MTAQIVALARQCRMAQRLYFADRSQENLIEAKKAEKALDDALAALSPGAGSRTTKRLPPEDWQPRPDTITKLEREFPHHDLQAHLADILAEWITACHAKGFKYANLDAAFCANVRRWADRRARPPARLDAARRGQYSPPRGVAGAVAGLLLDDRQRRGSDVDLDSGPEQGARTGTGGFDF